MKLKVLLVLSVIIMIALPAVAMKVIMVTDVGGLGDKSFNDGTWEGIVKAADFLSNLKNSINNPFALNQVNGTYFAVWQLEPVI